jgi:hypothetical protein
MSYSIKSNPTSIKDSILTLESNIDPTIYSFISSLKVLEKDNSITFKDLELLLDLLKVLSFKASFNSFIKGKLVLVILISKSILILIR